MHNENGAREHVWRLHRLDAWEAGLIRPILVTRESRLRRCALTLNHLGNGWLFGVIILVMPPLAGAAGWRFVRLVAVALAVAFSAYPFLKRFIGRVRPCHADRSLDALVVPLDLYSCPSGHTMTAAIFGVALLRVFPSASIVAFSVFALVAWSRLALGHHYPSDVVLGASFGTAVTLISTWVMP